ncbi:hypothetical protein Droror1_Dr00023418 [Drosera rotundifolia]
MNPRAKKKARAMSHGMGSPKAEKAAEKGSVFVSTEAPRPRRAQAPRGSGCVMMAMIVARNMESSCHAGLVSPAGVGTSQSTIPVARDANSGLRAAPWSAGFVGGPTDGDAAAEARITRREQCLLTLGMDSGTRASVRVCVRGLDRRWELEEENERREMEGWDLRLRVLWGEVRRGGDEERARVAIDMVIGYLRCGGGVWVVGDCGALDLGDRAVMESFGGVAGGDYTRRAAAEEEGECGSVWCC